LLIRELPTMRSTPRSRPRSKDPITEHSLLVCRGQLGFTEFTATAKTLRLIVPLTRQAAADEAVE
jgi:hypothetical protein